MTSVQFNNCFEYEPIRKCRLKCGGVSIGTWEEKMALRIDIEKYTAEQKKEYMNTLKVIEDQYQLSFRRIRFPFDQRSYRVSSEVVYGVNNV